MLEETAILRLKRSKSDVDDLVPVGELTPPKSPSKKTTGPRVTRAFSWTKLTEPFRGRRRSSRSSRERNERSSPPTDDWTTQEFRTSKPSSVFATPSSPVSRSPTAQSSPDSRISKRRRTPQGHAHSNSDPTSSCSPRSRCSRPPSRPPPPPPPSLPIATSFGSIDSLPENSLERIPESPLEYDPFEYDRPSVRFRRKGWDEKLEKMEPSRLQPPAMGGTKGRAIQQAKEMEMLVAERAKRSGDEPPPYEFFELIGKGAYGRVFKGKSRKPGGGLVAIKIIDIDKVDYEEMTTKNLSETLKEIDILQQLRDSKARPYVNIIEEARPVHNELWIISEYASGGSVNTLMKPTMNIKIPGPGLPEKFIIPIARELALGLKYIHEAGVLHRDLKSNNVLILEDGRVQLCDFGVSNTLEPQKSKRSTIVGTPYWMAPELQKEWVKDADPNSYAQPKEISYGNEVDMWAYGCTVYEMACGFPPHHRVVQWDLPTAGVPVLEGDRFSKGLKDFIAFVLQYEAHDRPTPDQILEHPYVSGSLKTHPIATLIELVEEYYAWEFQGGARQSLFNPYGAQAPHPLAPEPEDEDDDDWSFSTSDEFEQEHAPRFAADPFAAGMGEPLTSLSMPVPEMGRWEKMQAMFKEQSIERGQKRLDKLFNLSTTPYRYSAVDIPDGSSGRPPSDLVLREKYDQGAPDHRETVIDLDFSMPDANEVPSIDLDGVVTIKANRVKSLIRQMNEEDQLNALDEEEETKEDEEEWTFPETRDKNRKTMEWSFSAAQKPSRKTMEWSFPADSAPAKPDRKTKDWTFPTQQPKPNRRTVEWKFDTAMAEANNERRQTKDWKFPKMEENRRTKDWTFPAQSPPGRFQGRKFSNADSNQSSSPILGSGFRPTLRHAQTAPMELDDDFPQIVSAPASPMRNSMIDLDDAVVDSFRPSTSGSESAFTGKGESMENPFNLEDQVHLSQNNQRASYHTKSQSEPNHAVPGLLTPQQYDDQGQLANQNLHPSLHTRGVSSASQVQTLPRPPIAHRSNQRSQQILWDGWSHNMVYGLNSDDQSPPMSVTTDLSLEEEDIDELWDTFDRLLSQTSKRNQIYTSMHSSRRTDSSATTLVNTAPNTANNLTNTTATSSFDSDTDFPYYSSDSAYEDLMPTPLSRGGGSSSSGGLSSYRKSKALSVGPNGTPLVVFPVPKGPDIEALMGVEPDARVMQDLLLKSALELRDGTRAARDLLRAMRLEEVELETGMGMGMRGNGVGVARSRSVGGNSGAGGVSVGVGGLARNLGGMGANLGGNLGGLGMGAMGANLAANPAFMLGTAANMPTGPGAGLGFGAPMTMMMGGGGGSASASASGAVGNTAWTDDASRASTVRLIR